ncbi:hypothetical protein [Bradyrhizobium sp. RD5-C2]|uniref:DUF6894 family protein n=1 Tax=Bradyrhizobium sp. RD5-C2 TaxID=244562 RepID=UPI001CC6D2AD|nr:hypothetical protein [Bradyrhizobium sp. RD5-C2]GIQ75526.1 hypothetical protein BraRD5C2_39670 [Bradyrhizobium sp. RD5-C2]
MAQYYFDLRDSRGTTIDEEGLALPDLQAVQNEAAQALGVMARDAALTALDGVEQMEIEVRDEEGPVMLVRFSFEITRNKQS